jgi:hypothetical protein
MMTLGLPLNLFAMFLLGLPLALHLRAKGKLTAINVCVGAVLIGITVAGAFYLLDRPSVYVVVFPIGFGVGLLAGVVFSLLAGIRMRRVAA